MKWYEEGNGTFKDGVHVLGEYDQFVQRWGKKIQNDPTPASLKELFENHVIDEQMFEDIMDRQAITAKLFFVLLGAANRRGSSS